jgi:outer membrane protein assembly factor BamB
MKRFAPAWLATLATLAAPAALATMLCGDGLRATRGGEPNADLPRFLPNDGNCVYAANGLLRQWPSAGPKELWRVDVGWGKSAVVEAGGLAFTAGESDDKQWAICLDPATGAERWKRVLLAKPNRHFEWGPCTSPVVDGDRVYYIPYAIAGSDVWEMRCPIICLKTDGSELWRADKTFWGTEASTPLVVGETLYVGADNPQRVVLVALDKRTGKLRWSVKADPPMKNELGAPASLTYQVVDGVPQVIVATYGTRELLGVHAETGEIMWRYPYPARIIIGLLSTPVAIGSRLFVCAGEEKGREFSTCLEMKAADGKIACRELYVSTDLQTNMFHTASIYDGAVFGFGGGAKAGFLHATNFDDGRLLWKQTAREWTNQQNLVVADGLIFALTKDDQLVMAEASRERYKELGRVRLGMELGRPQQPTLANGRLYIRGKKIVVCYQVAK